MDWDTYNTVKKQQKKSNYDRAMATFEAAQELAKVNDYILEQHSTWHFSLTCRDASYFTWRYNLYPGNQRIYIDKQHRGLFLKVPHPWTFLDVVSAVIIQSQLDPVKKAIEDKL